MLGGLAVSLACLGYVLATAPRSHGITVVDGDTVRQGGHSIRLVGFNTPERAPYARCQAEAEIAERATRYMRELVRRGASLHMVDCSCPPEDLRSPRCNFGRLCAIMTVPPTDIDAAQVMVRLGLATPLKCGLTSCPKRGRPWCN